MATEIEYALMAGRIYQSTRGKINWLPDLLSFGWTERVDKSQSLPSGFEATYFTKGTEIVISFAGTGSNVDWWANAGGFFGVTTEQLQQAADYYLQVKAANPPGTIISFTGHSLGGGLASLMAVFFGETALTFDQAPFRNSASVAVATTLKDYLHNQQGYSETALQGLTNFISAAASGGIPNESNVIDFSVQGEILSAASGLRIGTPTSLTHGAPDLLLATSLHSEALLSAFVQNDQFREVTFKLPDVVRMIFNSDLYEFPTAGGTRNFIENLVRHQNGIAGLTLGETPTPADAMLTRYTDDLWKLAQDGGLTMSEGTSFFGNNLNNVSNTLIAFAMQKYYDETQMSAGYNEELFTDLATAGLGSGGLQFDRADVAATLNDAKGYNLYFQHYLDSSAFSNAERQLMQSLLPTLRDWYVQAGSGGMEVADAENRGAFMLGGSGADTLTGGTQADLLVGHGGNDTLDGGAGADTMLGGQGNDTYTVDNIGDIVTESVGNGTDAVSSTVSYTLTANVENLTLMGTAISATGNALANLILGDDKANLIEGKGGNDQLNGGGGLDIYYFNGLTDGNDTIMDSDGIGAVEFNKMLLSGGVRKSNDPQDTWHSADGTITYVKEGADLIVNDKVTITAFNFADGQLGIRLRTGPDTTRPALPSIDFNNGQPSVQWDGDEDSNAPTYTAAANHIARGYGGNDTLDFSTGSAAFNHQVYGGAGNDTLDGGAGQDRLYGEQNNDTLRGGLGNDALDGGIGNDELVGGTGNDQIFGDAGDDHIFALNPFAPLEAGSDNDYVDGGSGIDTIVGGRGNDVLLGGDGDDLLNGEGFVVNGRLDFHTGDDYLDGGADNDGLTGGPGDDILLGGTGNDLLNGDHFISLPENPIALPEWDPLVDGEDYLDGGEGDDVLHGGGYDDILIGGQGDDRLWGDGFGYTSEPGDDWLDGGDDDDELYGGAGADTLLGGDGDDLLAGDFSYDPGDDDILDGGAGIDELQGGGGNDFLFGGTEADLLFGEDGADVLDGGQGEDQLEGGDGNDLLVGGTENDLLFGQVGDDDLDGGAGDDILVGDVGSDVLFGGDGNDQLDGGAGANFLAGGTGNDLLAGGADADLLFGGDDNDVLQGGAGNDELTGGAGADVLAGGAGADTYVFNLGDGVDSIIDTPGEGNKVVLGAGIFADDIGAGIGSLVVRVGVNGDAIHIQGFDPENPTVQVGIETIEFADGTTLTQADLVARGFDLMGTAGNDSLNGGETYRAIYGFDGNDFLTGGAIDNVLNGGSGNDSLFGEGGIDQLFGGTGDDIMHAGEGDDLMKGEAGNDSLAGEAGDDVLIGGAGDDQLYGGAGNDTYRFNLGDGLDSISDSIDAGEFNRVLFGSGITSSSVTLTTNFGQVLVRPGAAFEGVTVGANGSNALGFHAVDNFEFTDGTILTYAQLIARGFDIDGTDGVDFLSGTSVTDRINSYGGSDSIQANEGDDTIDAGTGDDSVDAGDGNDMVMGGEGNDFLSGRADNDTLIGGEGNDTLRGGSGDDQLLGGAGDDIMYGEGGNDLVDGGVGNDQLIGRPGTYTYAFGTGSGHDIIDSTQGGSYSIHRCLPMSCQPT